MPLTKRQTLIDISTSEINELPTWARMEYKKSLTVLSQILQKATQLQKNITDLEDMLQSGECPRSLQVKVAVNVQKEQQLFINGIVENAKKQFQQSVLAGLVQARKEELKTLQIQSKNNPKDFQDFLRKTLEDFTNHDIPIEDGEEHINSSIQSMMQMYESRAEKLDAEIKTKHFFDHKKELERKQKKEEAKQQRQIDQELTDPHLKALSEKIDKIEKYMLKAPKTQKPKQDGNRRNSRNDKPPSKGHPKGKGPGQNKTNHNKKKSWTKEKPQQKGRKNPQGQDQENRRQQHRSTNSTNRSASRNRNSRKKLN